MDNINVNFKGNSISVFPRYNVTSNNNDDDDGFSI